MNNLIITILSILLAAVVAVMSILYVGPLYNYYLAQSKANEIINDMQQLQNAMVAWSMDNGGIGTYPTVYAATKSVFTFETAGAACGDIGHCWYSSLTNQQKYLGLPNVAANFWYPPLNLGTYGTVIGGSGFPDGYFSQSAVGSIVWDTTSTHQYILTQFKTAIYTNPVISQTQLDQFLIQICQDINKNLGVAPSYTGYTLDTSTLSGTNVQINLPVDSSGVWSNAQQPVDGSTLMNVCFLAGNTAGAGPALNFMLYFKVF